MYSHKFSPDNEPFAETFDENELRELEEMARQKDRYLQKKAGDGFDLLTGRETLDPKKLTKQIDQLSFLFWRGSESRGITGHNGDDLARARMILCVLHLHGFPVTEGLIQGKVIPRVLNRVGKKSTLSIKETLAFSRNVLAINQQIINYFRNQSDKTAPISEVIESGLCEVFSAIHLFAH